MPKIEKQSGRVSARFGSARGAALADDGLLEAGGSDDGFYRPPVAPRPRSGSAGRSLPGDLPFRDGMQSADELEDEPFLRSRRRVPVRKGWLPTGRWGRIGLAAGGAAVLGCLVWLGFAVHGFLAHDPRFRIESSDNIQILGNSQVTGAELLGVFGGDIGRNVFFVPLTARRGELERVPWVEHATVMRLLPDQLRVAVVERTPIAFVRAGNEIGLVDHAGVLLTMPASMIAAKHYSFPVVTGIDAGDPLSTRAARMRIYQRFVAELDSTGDKFSGQLSEVDLSDPEDVRAVVPAEGSDLLLHFGDQDFLARWQNYLQHRAEWKQQYPKLASVDLRYDRQVVLEMQKGTVVGPNQDAAGKTMDDLKADASAVSPIAARQLAAANGKKPAAAAHRETKKSRGRNQGHGTKA